MNNTNLKPLIVAGYSSQRLAKAIAERLDTHVIDLKRKQHEDREIGNSIEENIRGREVVVVASASGDPNKQEKETRLLMRNANRSGAESVTLLLPYMWYGRSDDTWDERQVAALTDTIETLSPHCNNVIVVDPHNAPLTRELFLSSSNDVKTCQTVHMGYPFAKHLKQMFAENAIDPKRLMFMHADAGSTKRISRSFRECMQSTLGLDGNPAQDDWAVAIKDRDKETGKSRVKSVTEDVKGKDVVVVEDMVSSGETLMNLAAALKGLGARSVTAFATNGLFTAKDGDILTVPIENINGSKLDHLIIGDTYNHRDVSNKKARAIEQSPKITILRTGDYLAEIIKALHAEPISNDVTDQNSISAILAGRHPYQKAELDTLR